MPAFGEKGFREEIEHALEERWARLIAQPTPGSAYANKDSFKVIATGKDDSIIRYCGDLFILTVREV